MSGGASPPDKKSTGPFAPPTQDEAEREKGMPMALANDLDTVHGESHLPTSQTLDAYDHDVAKRWETVPGSADAGKTGEDAIQETFTVGGRDEHGAQRKPETKKMVHDPPGYTEPDEDGYRHLKWDEKEQP